MIANFCLNGLSSYENRVATLICHLGPFLGFAWANRTDSHCLLKGQKFLNMILIDKLPKDLLDKQLRVQHVTEKQNYVASTGLCIFMKLQSLNFLVCLNANVGK